MSKTISARRKAYDAVKEDILSGRLGPGEQIVEIDYSKKLSISRTPLREALRNLEIEGLVESIANKGVFVKRFSIEELKEVFELRLMVETYIHTKAFYKVNRENLNYLTTLLEQTKTAHTEGNDLLVTELFDAFHQKMMDISELSLSIKFLDYIRNYMHIVRKQNLIESKERFNQAIKEHEVLIELMRTSDITVFEQACKDHILRSQMHFFEGYKNK